MRFLVYRPSTLHIVSAFIVLAFAVGVYAVLTFTPKAEFAPVPNIVLEDRNGNPIGLHELTKGRVALINVWASWCPYCTVELPDFARLKESYPDIAIIAINRKESRAIAEAYLKEHDVSLASVEILYDPQDVFYRAIHGVGMPETVLVNEQGQIALHRHGPMTFEEMKQAVETLQGREETFDLQ